VNAAWQTRPVPRRALCFLHLAFELRLLRVDIRGIHRPDLSCRFLLFNSDRLSMAASPDGEIAEHEKPKRDTNTLQPGNGDRALWRLVLLADSRRFCLPERTTGAHECCRYKPPEKLLPRESAAGSIVKNASEKTSLSADAPGVRKVS